MDVKHSRSRSAQAGRLAGPLAQLEAIYSDHADYVYNLAYRLTGQAGEADDLLQDTFVRAYRYLDGFAGTSLRGWLRRIAVNLFADRCKVRQRETLLSFPAGEHADLPARLQRALHDTRSDPGAQVEVFSLDERLQRALDALSPEHRAVLVLREIDDLSYDQIAAALEIPVGTVRSRLARARLTLRDLLQDAYMHGRGGLP